MLLINLDKLKLIIYELFEVRMVVVRYGSVESIAYD